MTRCKKSILIIVMMSLPTLVSAASVYETQMEFLSRAFGEPQPTPNIIWLSGERKSSVQQMLGHDYPAMRLRYWCQAKRSAWVLEEIGKELPITIGVTVRNDAIVNVQVLEFRESRGWEVRYPFFTDQFHEARLAGTDQLDRNIDGITGATLSVGAVTRMARVALILHENIE